jgi:hypothetical protein
MLHYPGQDDPQMTMVRLALVQGVVTVLASGLGMLRVEAPDERRADALSIGPVAREAERGASTGKWG